MNTSSYRESSHLSSHPSISIAALHNKSFRCLHISSLSTAFQLGKGIAIGYMEALGNLAECVL